MYHNIGGAVRGIVRQKGIRGLYSGLSVTLMEIIPYAALQFGSYDALTAAYTSTRRQLNPEVCYPAIYVPCFLAVTCALLYQRLHVSIAVRHILDFSTSPLQHGEASKHLNDLEACT